MKRFFPLLLCLGALACKNSPKETKEYSMIDPYPTTDREEIAMIIANYSGGYDQLQGFSEGRAIFTRKDTTGFINMFNEETMLPELVQMEGFIGGWAIAKTKDDTPCYVDTLGKIVQKFPNYTSIFPFDKEAYAVFVDKNKKYGLMDKSFKEVIPAKYDLTSFWKYGLFIVAQGSKWGAVDIQDKTVIPFDYDMMSDVDDMGYIQAKKGGFHGFIDKTGKVVVPFVHFRTYPFSENFAFFTSKQGGEYGLINRKGEVIVPPKYEDNKAFSGGLAAVSINKKWGFIDNTGKEIIPIQYTSVESFTPEGYASVVVNDRVTFIDKKGQKAFPKLDALEVIEIKPFTNGFARIKLTKNEEDVYMDRFGNILTYNDIGSLSMEMSTQQTISNNK
jgi:WG containing repeat